MMHAPPHTRRSPRFRRRLLVAALLTVGLPSPAIAAQLDQVVVRELSPDDTQAELTVAGTDMHISFGELTGYSNLTVTAYGVEDYDVSGFGHTGPAVFALSHHNGWIDGPMQVCFAYNPSSAPAAHAFVYGWDGDEWVDRTTLRDAIGIACSTESYRSGFRGLFVVAYSDELPRRRPPQDPPPRRSATGRSAAPRAPPSTPSSRRSRGRASSPTTP